MKLTWQPEWEESLGETGSMYIYGEFLHCSSETVMALLIDCTPKQNKKVKKKVCYGGKNSHADYAPLYLLFDMP